MSNVRPTVVRRADVDGALSTHNDSPGRHTQFVTYTADEHDALVQAHADALSDAALPCADELAYRTGLSAALCQRWIDAGRYWPEGG